MSEHREPQGDGWYWLTTPSIGTQLVRLYRGVVTGPDEPQSGTPLQECLNHLDVEWIPALPPRGLREVLADLLAACEAAQEYLVTTPNPKSVEVHKQLTLTIAKAKRTG